MQQLQQCKFCSHFIWFQFYSHFIRIQILNECCILKYDVCNTTATVIHEFSLNIGTLFSSLIIYSCLFSILSGSESLKKHQSQEKNGNSVWHAYYEDLLRKLISLPQGHCKRTILIKDT